MGNVAVSFLLLYYIMQNGQSPAVFRRLFCRFYRWHAEADIPGNCFPKPVRNADHIVPDCLQIKKDETKYRQNSSPAVHRRSRNASALR